MTKLTRSDTKPGVAAGDRVREERAKYQRETDDAIRSWRDSSAELPSVVVIHASPQSRRGYFDEPAPDSLASPRGRRSFIDALKRRDRRAVGGALAAFLLALAGLIRAALELWGSW